MMKFLRTLFDTLLSKDFYHSVIRGEKNIGFGFVFKLQIVAALFLTILLSINISTVMPFLDRVARDILPDGAEVIIKDGILDTNTNPIVVPFPEKSKGVFTLKGLNLDSSSDAIIQESALNEVIPSTVSGTLSTDGSETIKKPDIKNVLVLDITASTTPDVLLKKNTLILVTAEGVIVKNDSGRFSISYFRDVKDLDVSIDETWLISKAEWAKGFARFIPFIAFVFLLLSLFVGSLIAALLYGFGTWLMFKLLKKPQPFVVAYSIGLYSRTFATCIGLLTFIIPVFGSNLIIIPLELAFIFIMIKDIRKAHSHTDIKI
jgi:maltodextrin utilization protein YvdJ